MNKIIIDYNENIIRTAVIDDKGLRELIIDKKENESLVGNIYAGIVRNILPSQFAFVDIGRNKNGFLFLTDKKEERLFSKDKKKLTIKGGNHILVQVVKDETGDKGVYVTSEISFTDRLAVLIKSGDNGKEISISKKIKDENERERLRDIALKVLPDGFELILRTNCSGENEENIKKEILGLLTKYEDVFNIWQYQKPPCLVFSQEDSMIKNLKDLYNENIEQIIINEQRQSEKIKYEVKDYFTDAEKRVEYYENRDIPIFNYYSVTSQINKILNKKVWLKSGGFLIIEQTEACAVIDVNSGKFAGKKDHEKSILKLNIEAGEEAARQIRLRNLSGIIIIDFVDMKYEESKIELMRAFAAELEKDRISTNLVDMTALGLVEITRKKMREPLSKVL